MWAIAYANGTTDHVRRGPELRLPEALADQSNRLLCRDFSLREVPATDGLRPGEADEAGQHARRRHRHRFGADRDRAIGNAERFECFERMIVVAPGANQSRLRRDGDLNARRVPLRWHQVYHRDAAWMGIRQGMQEERAGGT